VLKKMKTSMEYVLDRKLEQSLDYELCSTRIVTNSRNVRKNLRKQFLFREMTRVDTETWTKIIELKQ
jgi:hypothetical protein